MAAGSMLGGVGSLMGGLGSLGGALYSMFGTSGGEDDLQKAISLYRKVKEPDFDYTQLSFPELQIFSTYFPQLYEATVPAEFQQIADSPEMRASQTRNLGQLERVAQEGLPLEQRLAAQRASEQVQRGARQADLAVLQDLAQRGRLGAGDEIQSRMAMGQNSANLASQLGSDVVRQGIANQLGATTAAAGLAGQIRGQDVDLRTRNAEIANRFNELAANIRNDAAWRNAQERARTQTLNAGEQQRIGEANQLGQFQTQQQNIDRSNQLRQQEFSNRMSKVGGQAQGLNNLAQANYAQQAANSQSIQSLARGLGQAAGGAINMFGNMAPSQSYSQTISPGVTAAASAMPFGSPVAATYMDYLKKQGY